MSSTGKEPVIRAPENMTAWPIMVTGAEVRIRMESDAATLLHIVEALDRLEERLDQSPIPQASAMRGYFTPDEDDRVRQGLLVYRNCRLAAYEMILRHRHYAQIPAERERLSAFVLAFAAALVLYAKSLRIILFAEHHPMLRAKINEPDAKYDLGPGFFDDILAGYSSLANYRALAQADLFWCINRVKAAGLAELAGESWSRLYNLIQQLRHVVRKRLLHVLLMRLRYDWMALCRTVFWPARQARHGLERWLGRQFADAHLTTGPHFVLNFDILAQIGPILKPGDVLLSRADSRLTAALIPGFWTHAALFWGARPELERMGLREHPQVFQLWSKLPENPGPFGWVIESLCSGVQFNPLEKCLEADHVVALRPNLPAPEVASALGEAFSHLGKAYDFDFDFNVSSRLVCTELIYRSYHHRGPIEFTLTKRLGRFTLSGDDIIKLMLEQKQSTSPAAAPAFTPVALALKRRDGQAHLISPDRILPLLNRIQTGWHPSRQPKSGPAWGDRQTARAYT